MGHLHIIIATPSPIRVWRKLKINYCAFSRRLEKFPWVYFQQLWMQSDDNIWRDEQQPFFSRRRCPLSCSNGTLWIRLFMILYDRRRFSILHKFTTKPTHAMCCLKLFPIASAESFLSSFSSAHTRSTTGRMSNVGADERKEAITILRTALSLTDNK